MQVVFISYCAILHLISVTLLKMYSDLNDRLSMMYSVYYSWVFPKGRFCHVNNVPPIVLQVIMSNGTLISMEFQAL